MPTAPEIALISTGGAWATAARLLVRWLADHERIDALLGGLTGAPGRAERARCQHLLYGAVRHLGRLEAALRPMLAHPPRAELRAVLLLAGFELIEAAGDNGQIAKVVHHAVEQAKIIASPSEARLVNAVARRLAGVLAAQSVPGQLATADALAEWYSHPAWLVQRWLIQFGASSTRALLEWNQQPAPVYARWRDPAHPVPAWMKPSSWAGFFEIPPGHWDELGALLIAGRIYLQDPGARLAAELVDPQPGESVLDLCASPGGKSLSLADAMGTGRIVAVDRADARIDRLKENLARAGQVEVALVLGDVLSGLELNLREHRLPDSYPAVLLDAPCTNTGVMRHRVDVKWRLQDGDFLRHSQQQLALLHAAVRLVAPGGRLVYSTCSLDAEENGKVVDAFFASRAGGPFRLERQIMSRPWESGHDGAGVFLLRRSA